MQLQSFGPGLDVVVHGASRGIGLALVRLLLAAPNVRQVFATARAASRAPSLAALAAGGKRLQALDLDVTDEPSVAAAVDAVATRTDALRLMICTVGLLHDGAALRPEKSLDALDVQALQRVFAVNAVGPLVLAKHFRRLLPPAERAVLVNLSARVGSISDNRLGGWYAYRGAKAAQNMFTRNLSIELRRRARGVVCIAFHPGTVDTSLSQPFQRGVPAERLFTPDRAARQLLDVVDGLTPHDNGEFFAWDGQRIDW